MNKHKQLWWGYRHQSGTHQAKRFLSDLDIQEAHESPFAAIVIGPFLAGDRNEALTIVKSLAIQQECKSDHVYKVVEGSGKHGIPYWRCINCPKTIQST